MHELSVLIATFGEYVVKPLVWPIVFIYLVKGVATLLTENKSE